MKKIKKCSIFWKKIFYNSTAEFPEVLQQQQQHNSRIVEGFDVGKGGLPYQLQVLRSK